MKRLICKAIFVGWAVALATPSAIAADMVVKAPPPAAPSAADYSWKWYVEGRIAAGVLPEYDINITGTGPGTYSPHSGFQFMLDAGVHLTPNWRVELEFSAGRISGGSAYNFPHSGSVNAYGLLLNAHYAFLTGTKFTPYLGAGLGFMVLDVNNVGAVGGGFAVNDTDTVFAAALHAGLDYAIRPYLALTGRYTLLSLGSATFGSNLPGVITTKDSSISHLITFGLRYTFR